MNDNQNFRPKFRLENLMIAAEIGEEEQSEILAAYRLLVIDKLSTFLVDDLGLENLDGLVDRLLSENAQDDELLKQILQAGIPQTVLDDAFNSACVLAFNEVVKVLIDKSSPEISARLNSTIKNDLVLNMVYKQSRL